jgi:hypothetical protein
MGAEGRSASHGIGGMPAAGEAHAKVVDMRDDLFEELGDVVVVQLVDDLAPVALADDEAEVAQRPKLMRDGRALHVDRGRELVDRRRTGVQAREDPQPARRRKRLDALRRRTRERRVDQHALQVGMVVAVGHLVCTIAERMLSYAATQNALAVEVRP